MDNVISEWLTYYGQNFHGLWCLLLLNVVFAFVELVYGIWANSLILITDAFHMFFDCTALLASFLAFIISQWSATEDYSYGYARAEILAGFVSSLFLLHIAFLIISEAIMITTTFLHTNWLKDLLWLCLPGTRTFQPPEVKHDHLYIVSVAGLIVNIIGIVALHYGHCHGQKGVFLHLLADTLSSVGAVVSSVLVRQFGLVIADPICSLFIAITIAISVLPLLRESVTILMQRTPYALSHQLPRCYLQVRSMEGVHSVHDPHFWTLCSNVYVGTIKIQVGAKADSHQILYEMHNIFSQIGVSHLCVQIEHVH